MNEIQNERFARPIPNRELERRWSLVRNGMKEQGIDCLVMQNDNQILEWVCPLLFGSSSQRISNYGTFPRERRDDRYKPRWCKRPAFPAFLGFPGYQGRDSLPLYASSALYQYQCGGDQRKMHKGQGIQKNRFCMPRCNFSGILQIPAGKPCPCRNSRCFGSGG